MNIKTLSLSEQLRICYNDLDMIKQSGPSGWESEKEFFDCIEDMEHIIYAIEQSFDEETRDHLRYVVTRYIVDSAEA